LNLWVYFTNINAIFTGVEKVVATIVPSYILLHSIWFSYFPRWVLWVYLWILEFMVECV